MDGPVSGPVPHVRNPAGREVRQFGQGVGGMMDRKAGNGGCPPIAEGGKISNANLALLIGLISAAVFVVSLFKFRTF